jgi:DNA-binding CsgD family transcriptional regulator/tetratricopeptide (TPR) repeat protein
MELLEREVALNALGDLMLEAVGGQGRLAFLGGEAGVGKTVLVQRFCESQRGAAQLFTGSCDALTTPRPLGPLMDMAPTLGDEFVELIGAEGKRSAVFAYFLGEISDGPRPTLVLFEDVHWADDSTLDLLRFLGRRLATTKCLVVATYRDEEVGPRHRLRMVMGDVATSAAVRRLSLNPLSESAVATMASGTGIDPIALHRRTGGNPFFITEILAAGRLGIPGTLRDAVLARAARLSPAARSVLEAASVIGLRAETGLLLEISDETAVAVEECLSLGVLESEPDALSFRHELARETILESIASPRAIELHKRVLAALSQASAERLDLARLLQHAEAAGDVGAVLQYAPLAARQAASLRAHREAAAQYARALRFGDGLPPATRADYLEGKSYESELTDELPEAIAARQEALDLRRVLDDQVKVGEDLRRLSWLYRFSGLRGEAEAAGRQAVEVLESQPAGPQLAWAYSNQAHLRMLDADIDGAIEWGERAVELGRRFGDTDVLAHAANNMGSARLSAGDEGGRRQLQYSLRIARAAGSEAHVGRAYSNLIAPSAWNWRIDQLDRYVPEGLAYCAEHDLDGYRLYIQSFQAFLQLCHGRWEDAKRYALSVITRANVSPPTKMVALAVLGRVRARRGDSDVFQPLDEALLLAQQTGELLRLGPVRTARAEAYWLAGDQEAAAAEADAVIDLAAESKHTGLLGELAYWRWRSGRDQPVPEGGPKPFRLEMLGRWSEAAKAWTRLGCPYEAAQALAQRDDPTTLRRALLEFERLGARPAAAATARRLRELGVKGLPRGPRATTRSNPNSLTDREMEVLGLLAEGLRNAEIAAGLHLSPKTVDHHVSAILAKLGVRSRTEAARAAEQIARLAKA